MKFDIKSFIKKLNLLDYTVLILIFFGVALRIHFLWLNESWWYDTCALGANIAKPFSDFFKPLDYLQVSPPLFMCFSKLMYSIFCYSDTTEQRDFVLRLLPFISSVLSLCCFPYVVNVIFKNKIFTALCTFFLAFNYYAIYFAREFKPYSSDLFISIILIGLFYLFDIKNFSIKKIFLISVFLSILVWCSNITCFMLLPFLIILLIEQIRSKTFYSLKTAVLFLPVLASIILFFCSFYLPVYLEQSQRMLYHWQHIEGAFLDFNNWYFMLQDKFSKIIGFNKQIVLWLFIINSVLLLCLKDYKIKILVLLPIFAAILFGFWEIYPFEVRLVLYLLPLFIILFSQIALYIQNTKSSNIIIAVSLIILSLWQIADISKQGMSYNKSNVRELYYMLKERNPKLNNVISVDELYVYYTGKKSMYSIEDFFTEDFSSSSLPKYITNLKKGEYWLLLPDSKPPYRDELKTFLEKNKKIKIDLAYINPDYQNTILLKFRKIR